MTLGWYSSYIYIGVFVNWVFAFMYVLRRKEPLYNPRWPPSQRGLLLANTRQEAPPWRMVRDGMIYWIFCLFAPVAQNMPCLYTFLSISLLYSLFLFLSPSAYSFSLAYIGMMHIRDIRLWLLKYFDRPRQLLRFLVISILKSMLLYMYTYITTRLYIHIYICEAINAASFNKDNSFGDLI